MHRDQPGGMHVVVYRHFAYEKMATTTEINARNLKKDVDEMCPLTPEEETRLRAILKMAEVLKENAEKSSFEQGDVMCEEYNRLLKKLISIDPEAASFLPDLSLKGSGAILVNLENRLREARLASGQMVAYLGEKLSSTVSLEYARNYIAIGTVANFFGTRSGQYSIDRLLRSLGIVNVLGKNKAEKISHILRDSYARDRYVFESVLNNLIGHHKLSTEDVEELESILLQIGYAIKDGKIVPTLPKETVEAEPKPFDAYLQIEKILKVATKEVILIDPYVDETLFPLYFYDLPPNVSLKILTNRMFDKFRIVARKFKLQKSDFEVRKTTGIHDRYLVIDQRAWIIGQSIKDAGRKPLSIIEIGDTSAVLRMFNRLWSSSTKVV